MIATIPPATRPARRAALVVALALAIPLTVLLVRLVIGDWLSISDWASIELRTRAVGGRHTPLVGPYSRYGWNHPGPLLFYALAIPYRLLGSEGTGLLAGALAINAAALAAAGTVLWRRGRLAGLTLGLALALLLVRALGAGFLVNPWNPYVIVFPMLAVVLLAWAATDGDLWALPLAVALGSFAIQSHVGAALGVLAPLVTALTFVAIDGQRDGLASVRKPLLFALGVGFLCWVPTLVQQFQPHGGNLSDLVSFWTRSHAHTTGWSVGARLVAPQLSLPAPWFTGHSNVSVFTGGVDPNWHVPYALFLLAGATALAAYRRDRTSFRLDILALTLVVAAWVSAARIVDTPFDYVVQWLWMVGAIVWLAIFWTVWRAFPRDAGWDELATIKGVVACTVLVTVVTVGAVHAGYPVASDERSLQGIAPAARRALRTLTEPVLVTNAPDLNSGNTAAGILTLAIHAGVDARFPTSAAYVVGGERTISNGRAGSLVVVADDDAAQTYLNNPTTYRSVARYDPLTPAERSERDAIQVSVLQAEVGGVPGLKRWIDEHPKEFARAIALDGRGQRVELFLQTP